MVLSIIVEAARSAFGPSDVEGEIMRKKIEKRRQEQRMQVALCLCECAREPLRRSERPRRRRVLANARESCLRESL